MGEPNMNAATRDRVLDEVRAAECRRLREVWPLRCGGSWKKHGAVRCSWCRRLRDAIDRIRALDDVRELARDRAYMAELWMYIACGLDRAEAMKRARDSQRTGGR